MKTISKETIDCFVSACREAAGYGLMRCSSGNMSMRTDGDRMLIKASRSWMARMTAGDVSVCTIKDGSLLEGRKPSVEIGFHAGILKARPDVNIVLHFQTPCATALACQEVGNINYFVIPEIPVYVGHIGRVPYITPGSSELAKAVIEAMLKHDMVIMDHHGLVTVARDADHAIQNAVFFELACEIILRSGNKAVPLSDKDAQALLKVRQSAGAGV